MSTVCVDAVFACKYEQSHGLSIIKAQWGKKSNNKPRHAWWLSMLHNVNSSLTHQPHYVITYTLKQNVKYCLPIILKEIMQLL